MDPASTSLYHARACIRLCELHARRKGELVFAAEVVEIDGTAGGRRRKVRERVAETVAALIGFVRLAPDGSVGLPSTQEQRSAALTQRRSCSLLDRGGVSAALGAAAPADLGLQDDETRESVTVAHGRDRCMDVDRRDRGAREHSHDTAGRARSAPRESVEQNHVLVAGAASHTKRRRQLLSTTDERGTRQPRQHIGIADERITSCRYPRQAEAANLRGVHRRRWRSDILRNDGQRRECNRRRGEIYVHVAAARSSQDINSQGPEADALEQQREAFSRQVVV